MSARKKAAATKIYSIRPGAPYSASDAQRLGEELDGLSARNGGRLKPDEVVAAAMVGTLPTVRKYLEWDDAKCGEAHRRGQAQRLISAVRFEFVTPSGTEQVPAFMSIQTEDDDDGDGEGAERHHFAFDRVMSTRSLRESLIEEAKAQLVSWRRRYAHLHELAEVFEAVDKATAQAAAAMVPAPQRKAASPQATA